MRTETTNERMGELLVVLDRLAELHRELLSLIRDKIEHMRSADTDRLRAATVREESLLQIIGEQEGLRRQLMDAIGRGYGINSEVGPATGGTDRSPVARRAAERRRATAPRGP